MKAYPFQHKNPTSGLTTSSEGMELRDYFAAKAMQASLTNNVHLIDQEQYDSLGKLSYKVANAMLKQRKDVPNE